MEMNNHQGRINLKCQYLLVAFLMLVGFQLALGQKHNYKDYVIEDFANAKITGKISLNKRFWYSTIYFENKDQGIYEHYNPRQLRSFSKGDSMFIVVRVDYKKFKEYGMLRRNFALVLNDTGTVKLYKSYIPLDNKELKEVFFYSRQEMNDSPVLMEDNKNSVLAAVSDCKSLANDILQSGYEYNETYFRRLFENYNKWLKDSTATLFNVAGNPILKSYSASSLDTSSAVPLTDVSETTVVKSDSMSLSDTSSVAPLANVKQDSISSSDTMAIEPSVNVSEITTVQQDSSSTSSGVKDSPATLAPLIDGFASGDSIWFEYNGFYPGKFLNHAKNGKYAIQYEGMGGKWKTQNVNSSTVYKISEHPENKSYFGFEIGENAAIEVFVIKLNTKVLKPCTIIGLNKTRVVISYLTDEGKERILSVDKNMIKQEE